MAAAWRRANQNETSTRGWRLARFARDCGDVARQRRGGGIHPRDNAAAWLRITALARCTRTAQHCALVRIIAAHQRCADMA
jgi:hypothetical protein